MIEEITGDNNTDEKSSYIGIYRDDWGARPPTGRQPLDTPVKYVVIHHSPIPPACSTRDECSYAMRTMQSMHMDDKNWSDIGYNFVIGGDGEVYEGRGWTSVGTHTDRFNNISLGICLLGNWDADVPPSKMLEVTKNLIAAGVENEFIAKDYQLFGHRQIRETECPGKALQKEIETWPNFEANPQVNSLRSKGRSQDIYAQLLELK